MRIGRLLLGLALCLPVLAHADDDWLAGEYDVVVPDDPAHSRSLLVIKQGVDGHYRAEAFRRSGEAGRILTPVERPPDSKLAEVHVLSDADIASAMEPRFVLAHVRCADVEGMALCLVPEGQRLDVDGRTLASGYFGIGMEATFIEIHKRPPGTR